MRNMFNVLYTRYIDQIKLQEIQNYNQKHRDYLVRSGKQSNNPEQYAPSKNHIKSQNRQVKPKVNEFNQIQTQSLNKENTQKRRQLAINKQTQNFNSNYSNDDVPIKPGKNKFDFSEYPQQPTVNDRQINSKPQQLSQGQYQNQKPTSIKQPPERTIKPVPQSKSSNQPMTQFAQQNDQVILQECPEGCGRKFKPQTLQKHVRICQKVFQAKRKPFKVDVVDDQAKKIASKNGPHDAVSQKPKSSKMPKWKKESEMLRKGLKSQQAGSQQSIPVEEEDDRIKCGGCGRKFNEVAAKKHIESCMNRNKQKR